MNSEVMDKIRKLLRLGQSSNQNEAALALARAFELARKHQIDLGAVNIEDEEIERLLIRVGARVPFERKLILNVVKRFFRVEIIIARPHVAFIGRKTDIAIANYAHDFLLRSLRCGLREFQSEIRRKMSRTRKQSYIQGWIYGVASKLENAAKTLAVEDSRLAIIAIDDDPRVQAAARQYYPETFTRRPEIARRNRSAMMTGYCAGRNVDINQPLNGPARPALQG